MNKQINQREEKVFQIVTMSMYIIISIAYICNIFLLSEKNDNIEILNNGDIIKAQTIDSLINLKDSLESELYPCEIELNRFQVAYQVFLKRNPEAAKQLGNIISEETE